MTRTIEQAKELGKNVAGTDSVFYADVAQDIAAIHLGFLKDGKTATKTLSYTQILKDPNLEDLLKQLKGSLESGQ